MRITTQMLDKTARRTGIPINQNNLLNYLNNTGSTDTSTLLDSIKKTNKVSSENAKNYEKLQKTADKLQESAEKLAATGDQSFFDKIRESGNSEELYTGITALLDNYNATLTDLNKSANPMNLFYSQALRDVAAENSKALENLGITVGKNGKLTADAEKLKNASVDDIEKVFGASGTFSSKTAFLAGRISDNAQANAESASSQYDAFGSLYSQLSSKYDFWG